MSQTLATPRSGLNRWAQYYALTKPRVVQLIVFCALIGMLLAEPGWPDLRRAGMATLGIWLVAGAAAAFNCLVEQRIDAKMARTAWRPTAKGELSSVQALLFSAVLCVLGSSVMYLSASLLIMAFVATMAGILVYLSLAFFLVRPMQRITNAMERFRADPDDPASHLDPSGRRD